MTAPTIDLAFDFASTASLLAFKPTCALADELGIDVRWLPFPTRTRTVPAKRPDETVGERHARVRAEYVAKDFARYAKLQGWKIARDAAGVHSELASMACLAANDNGPEQAQAYVERVFRDFWAGCLDIESEAALGGLAAELNLELGDTSRLPAQFEEHRKALTERGVFSVPTYIVDDQLFTGRQHLPMIRWLLTGSEGPGPL